MTGRSDDGFPSIRLDDRVALVTGAGRGLGRAYALSSPGAVPRSW